MIPALSCSVPFEVPLRRGETATHAHCHPTKAPKKTIVTTCRALKVPFASGAGSWVPEEGLAWQDAMASYRSRLLCGTLTSLPLWKRSNRIHLHVESAQRSSASSRMCSMVSSLRRLDWGCQEALLMFRPRRPFPLWKYCRSSATQRIRQPELSPPNIGVMDGPEIGPNGFALSLKDPDPNGEPVSAPC